MSAQSPRVRRDRRPFTGAVVTTAGLLLIGGVAGGAHRGLPRNDATAATTGRPAAGQPAAPALNNGRRVEFSTFLGGRLWDEANDTEVDASGNTYVAGFTLSQRFSNSAGVRRSFRELVDGFVAKFAPGGRLLWQTFLGGNDIDIVNSIALDSPGTAYVTGMTGSVDFPSTPGPVQPAIRGRNCQEEPCHDAFAVKLNPNGQIVYSTFLGGHFN